MQTGDRRVRSEAKRPRCGKQNVKGIDGKSYGQGVLCPLNQALGDRREFPRRGPGQNHKPRPKTIFVLQDAVSTCITDVGERLAVAFCRFVECLSAEDVQTEH